MKTFWKFLKIFFLIIFILLTVAIIGGYIFLKNFDIKKYKPQIVKAALDSTGRKVDFKDIDLKVSLQEGIRLHLTDFVMSEDPQFGIEPFLSTHQIDINVNVLSFLQNRLISLPKILIDSAQINIIRNSSGTLNVQTLAMGAQKTVPPGSSQPSDTLELPAVFINDLKIQNAQINLIDKSVTPEIKLSVDQLNVTINRFSLTEPFDFLVDAAVLSPQKNIKLTGTAAVKFLTKQAKLSDVEFTADLNTIALADLRAFPLLNGIPLPEVMNGQLKTKIKELTISEKGLSNAMLNISLTDGKIILPNAVPGISLESDKLNIKVDNFSLDGTSPFQLSVSAALFQGMPNVNLQGSASFDPKSLEIRLNNTQFSTDLALWPMSKMKTAIAPLKDVPLPQKMSGKFQLTIKELAASPAGISNVLLDASATNLNLDLTGVLADAPLAISQTDLTVQNFSFNRPFFVSLKSGLFNNTLQNFSFEGNITYNDKTQSITLNNTSAAIDLDTISLDQIRAAKIVPDGTPFPEIIGGKIESTVKILKASPKGLEDLKVDMDWHDGKIFVPQAAEGVSISAKDINLSAKDFSLKEPFALEGSLAYENEIPNISFKGNAVFSADLQNITLTNTTISSDLSQIHFDRIKSSIASLKDIPFPSELKGQLGINLKKLSVGAKGLDSILADVILADGRIVMTNIAPGISFAASSLDAQIKGLSLGSPFHFDIKMAYCSSTPDISADGVVAFDPATQTVTLKDTTFTTDLTALSLEELKNSIESLKTVSLPEKLEGQFQFKLSETTVGPQGLSSITGNGTLKNSLVKMKELRVPVTGLDTTFHLTTTDLIMDTINAKIGEGQITAQLSLKDYLSAQTFTLESELKEIDLSQILEQDKAPVKVEGLINGKLSAKGSISNLNSITGKGTFDVQQAELKDLNILKTVLDKISFVPNVVERIKTNLPDKYKQKLESADTSINKIAVTCDISNGLIVLDPTDIEADEFMFSGRTEASLDQKYTINGSFKIPAELSAVMVQEVPEFEYLYDDASNISFPVHISGTGAGQPAVSVTQTAVDMTKNAIKNKGKEELQKAIGNALGIPTDTQPSPDATPPQQQNQPPAQEQPSTEGELINGILNSIFK